MRNEKLIPGIILVTIGALFLLHNFGYIYFSWVNFFRLWPVLLLIAGVNMVFAHNRSVWATALKILVIVLGIGLFVFAGIGDGFDHGDWRHNRGQSFNFDDNSSDDDDTSTRDSVFNNKASGVFNEPYKPTIKAVVLNLSGGAASYRLDGTTTDLFAAHTKDSGNSENSLTATDEDSTKTLDFTMNNTKHHGFQFNLGGKSSNKAFIKLNPNPEWDINVQTGASKMDFNLAQFKVKHLKFEGGAASFNVILGMPLTETDVDISTGVSEVKIAIPKNAACHIITDTGLSSKNFEGFNKISDTEYETPGFGSASQKMYLNINGGVSDFKVKRY